MRGWRGDRVRPREEAGAVLTANRAPQIIVIAGPNGAGKTSAAPDLLRDAVGVHSFVNVDVIAEGLSGFRPQDAAFEAGRIMLARARELAERREDFALESTLSGRTLHTFLRRLAAQGYEHHIFYLWLPAADLAVTRVRLRVEAGGHDVPESVIRRRFRRSLRNFDQLYRPSATTWRLYDGGATVGRPLIAHGEGRRQPTILDPGRWALVRRKLEGEKR
ncbi:MAG: AAA family ATPase [Gemmatimonadetes bacterium]|nr:AAA family ATPase [Gemmatimonadota bacterium]